MEKNPRIKINPKIMFVKPVTKWTWISVEQMLFNLGAGISPKHILNELPQLNIADNHATQNFAADHLSGEEIIFPN